LQRTLREAREKEVNEGKKHVDRRLARDICSAVFLCGEFTAAFVDGGVLYYDSRSSRFARTERGYRPSISPSGDCVVYQTPRKEIFLWHPKEGTERLIATGTHPLFVKDDTIVFCDGGRVKKQVLELP